MSRKLYVSGKKQQEYITRIDSGMNPEELAAYLLCRTCEERFDRNGEDEVLKHIAAKFVLKEMPLVARMKVAWPRDNDASAPRYCATDFGVNAEKFAYFALSIVWRRTIHEWSAALPRWELGQFAEEMRRYLLDEIPFPDNMAVIVMVCSDETSRRMWTVPTTFVGAGCLNAAFDVREIRFRVLMGQRLLGAARDNLDPWSRPRSVYLIAATGYRFARNGAYHSPLTLKVCASPRGESSRIATIVPAAK